MTPLQELEQAIAASGLALLEADKTQIETAAHAISDESANKLITLVTSNVNVHGVAALVVGPLKQALINSEPGIDSMINTAEDNLISTIETALKNAIPK